MQRNGLIPVSFLLLTFWKNPLLELKFSVLGVSQRWTVPECFSQVLSADSEYERKEAKGNFQLEEWFYFVITKYFKAVAQLYHRWYILLAHHLVQKCHSWMDVVDRPQLRPQQLNRALCVQQLRLCISDLPSPGRRIGAYFVPQQTLVTELPSMNLFSFTHCCHWNVTELLIATAFYTSDLFLKLHDLAKKEKNKKTQQQKKGFSSSILLKS